MFPPKTGQLQEGLNSWRDWDTHWHTNSIQECGYEVQGAGINSMQINARLPEENARVGLAKIFVIGAT